MCANRRIENPFTVTVTPFGNDTAPTLVLHSNRIGEPTMTYPKLETRSATRALIDAAENGVLSWESIARAALDYMSEDDVAELAHYEFYMDEEEEED